jgi:predicted transcriptional regulator
MSRSKLEVYVDILKVLAQKGPLQQEHIMCQANINSGILKGYLDFLIKQDLIKESVIEKNSVIYSNTTRGAAVIKFFGETYKTLPVTQENNKFLPMSY